MLGLVGSLVGGGLFAYFSDTETATNNTFVAGTIDLAVNGQNPWVGPPSSVESKPCQWKRFELDNVTNVGDNDGLLWFKLDNLVWGGGQFPDAEQAVDPDNSCDIQDYLELIVIYCYDDNLETLLNGPPPAANFPEAVNRIILAGYGNPLYAGLFQSFLKMLFFIFMQFIKINSKLFFSLYSERH